MASEKLLVSVILPVYNGEAYLAEAVESVLRQAYRPLEIIIVDDGSIDGTAGVAASFSKNIRYVYQPNAGPSAARNRGLKMAGGDLIGFLDADDLWTEDALDTQLRYLADDPTVQVVVGYTHQIRKTNTSSSVSTYEVFSEAWPALSLGSTIIRKNAFKKIGCFDQTMKFCEDVDWLMRAKETDLPMVIHKNVIQFYRRHDHNLTSQKELGKKYFVTALKMSLDRRRRTGKGKPIELASWYKRDE